MKSYTFDELDERGQQAAINRYYADADYQDFITKVQLENSDESPTVSDWASACNVRFNSHGERIA